MSQGNVPISLLLDGGQRLPPSQIQNRPDPAYSQGQPPNGPQSGPPSTGHPRPMHNLISQYQAFVGTPIGQPPANLRMATNNVIVIEDEKDQMDSRAARVHGASTAATGAHGASNPPVEMLEYVKNFQAQFQYESAPHSQIPLPYTVVAEKPSPKPIKPAVSTTPTVLPSRTSINSLINSDESPMPASAPGPLPAAAVQPEKKKRANQKADGPNKKPKLEAAKKGLKADVKAETKKGGKGKKKTPEVALPATEKPTIHPTMTTDKVKAAQAVVKLASPAFIEAKKETTDTVDNASNDAAVSSKEKEKETKEKEKPTERPVIALEIPLLDPKNPQPGQAEAVINVLKLAEDKYGWNVIHPNAKSAIDLMDEILDDEEDGEEDEDDDLQVVEDKLNPQQKKKEELTEEQLVKKHQTRMNRKVGKYDYEDPFIDDAELQWEEEITTTKEGFFVYWGPLVDDKSTSATTKKSSGKGKK